MATIKMRFLTKFPALVTAATGLLVQRTGRVYNFIFDWLSVVAVDSVADPTTRFVLMVSGTGSSDQLYERIPLDKFSAALTAQVQEITTAGSYNVNANAAVVKVNLSVAGIVNLAMPAANAKIGRVKVVDFGGTASPTNPINVNANGSEKFNGAVASWVIGAAGASNVFDPLPGAGYAV